MAAGSLDTHEHAQEVMLESRATKVIILVYHYLYYHVSSIHACPLVRKTGQDIRHPYRIL